jgi:uncharacterized OB-fold protein
MILEGLANLMNVWYCRKCGRSNVLRVQICDYCHKERK